MWNINKTKPKKKKLEMTAEWRILKEEGKECRTKWGGALMTFGGGFWVLCWGCRNIHLKSVNYYPKLVLQTNAVNSI